MVFILLLQEWVGPCDLFADLYVTSFMLLCSALILASELAHPIIMPHADYTFVDTSKYSFEIPKGWDLGDETPWGARDILPKQEAGKMGAMTAGPTKATWAELYKTSLYFIQREAKGDPTPFRTGKTKLGYECMSFEVLNKDKFANRRYTLLKNSAGSALALSINIPSKTVEKKYLEMFQHMVDTAKIK